MTFRTTRLARGLDAFEPVPSEVADLTDETRDALARVQETFDALQDCFAENVGQSIDVCASQMNAHESAWRALPAVFDAWEPYL